MCQQMEINLGVLPYIPRERIENGKIARGISKNTEPMTGS